jgi:hypothetical protein
MEYKEHLVKQLLSDLEYCKSKEWISVFEHGNSEPNFIAQLVVLLAKK